MIELPRALLATDCGDHAIAAKVAGSVPGHIIDDGWRRLSSGLRAALPV